MNHTIVASTEVATTLTAEKMTSGSLRHKFSMTCRVNIVGGVRYNSLLGVWVLMYDGLELSIETKKLRDSSKNIEHHTTMIKQASTCTNSFSVIFCSPPSLPSVDDMKIPRRKFQSNRNKQNCTQLFKQNVWYTHFNSLASKNVFSIVALLP